MSKVLKTILIVSLFYILMFNSTSALSSDIKNTYLGLETGIVKIEGNIIEPITPSQIEFKRKNVLVPIEFDIKKIYNDNYIWFVTPKVTNETNYTLIIKNIVFQEFGQNKKGDLILNFSVTSNITDYYLTPGFISTKSEYSIEVESNLDTSQKINLDFPSKRELNINPGKNKFDFAIDEIDSSTFKIVKFGRYLVPVYIIKEGLPQNVVNNTISLSPSEINFEKETGSNALEYYFKIINIGANKIEDITLDYDDENVKITPGGKIDLESGEEMRYNLTLKKETNITQVIKITSSKNNINREIPINIRFSDYSQNINYTLVNQTIEKNNSGLYYCQELGGKECFKEQKCEGQIISTKNDVSCCIGKCSLLLEEKTSNSWIGYLIITIAIIGMVFAYIKYKKVKPSKTLLEKTLEDNTSDKKIIP